MGADGRQFSHALISAVAPILQQQVDDGLAQLVSAELILRRGTRPNAELLRGNQDENSLLTQIVALHGVYLQAPTADLLATIGRDGKVPPRFCAEYGHEVVETLVEKKTGKGLDAAAIWSAGLTAFSASGLSSADSD